MGCSNYGVDSLNEIDDEALSEPFEIYQSDSALALDSYMFVQLGLKSYKIYFF
jgi:hypothetical protein